MNSTKTFIGSWPKQSKSARNRSSKIGNYNNVKSAKSIKLIRGAWNLEFDKC